MKAGNFGRFWGVYGRFRGRQFSFTLAVLVLTTVFLWSREKSPLVTSLLPAQDQFIMHSSELLVDGSAGSSLFMKPSEHITKEYTLPKVAEDTTAETMKKGADNFARNITATSKRNEGKISTSSFEKKDAFLYFFVSESCLLIG